MVETPFREGLKPPLDYKFQEEVEALLRTHSYGGQIIYVDIGMSENEHLIEKYSILGSHVWVIEFENDDFETYEDDSAFFKSLNAYL